MNKKIASASHIDRDLSWMYFQPSYLAGSDETERSFT
mgnify:CR=1 FL=1